MCGVHRTMNAQILTLHYWETFRDCAYISKQFYTAWMSQGMKQLKMSPHIYTDSGSQFFLWTRFCPVPWRKSCPLCVAGSSTWCWSLLLVLVSPHEWQWRWHPLNRTSWLVLLKQICCDCTKIAPMCIKKELQLQARSSMQPQVQSTLKTLMVSSRKYLLVWL